MYPFFAGLECSTWIDRPDKGLYHVLLPCRGFPKKASRTARIASDEEIQGTKDAVIQDLERKLRFKEDLLNNGQPVWRDRGPGLGTRAPRIREQLFPGFTKT